MPAPEKPRENPPENPPGNQGKPPSGPASLHAPWRQEYIESIDDKKPAPGSVSFLHDYWQHPERDESNHVVVRTDSGMILLNMYPYAGGHLLVALGEPRPALLDYSADQRAALWKLSDLAAELMQLAINPQGINIGVNQGRAAGAGLPNHLHVHLVPRWNGDVNFVNIVGSVRIISASLSVMAARYRNAWEQIRSTPPAQ
ncbi:MAG: HIT domain-containing protein [Phycisphaerales bacterium]